MLIGQRLSGRYKIIEVIGGGGMANVYLAKDIILEREVAIKVLRFDFANDDEFIKRFHREAQAATSLAHPNIVSIYDVGEENGVYYIVMEYVEGQTLKQYIQGYAPLHPREALNIMSQIVSAIAHAHENQIVHRDIKPHNILIDRHGNIKVTDFGIAIALSSTTITQTNSVLGSVHYMSPEQARGGLANKKSDIYAMGIVFFELLTGKMPFDGESAIAIALKHLQTETPSPKRWNPDIPQSVENIILKATAKDSFYRYNTAEEMEADIETALDPSRINEAKFVVHDDEATKAVPVITDEILFTHTDEDTAVRTPENEEIKPDKKKKKSKFAIFIITMFVILIAAIIATFTILPSFLMPDDVKVPDVESKKYEEAVSILEDEGFQIDEPIFIADEEIEEDYVVKTEPAKGDIVKEGASIKIYKSTGKEKLVFDNYVGQNIDRVIELLKKRGFDNIKTNIEYSDTQLAGTILSQTPEQDDEVIPSETEVVFTVSDGPKRIKLIDLKGKTKEEVYNYVAENGLNINDSEQYSDEVPEGSVISHSPSTDKEVIPKETTLHVIFSKGPKEKPVKTVKKEIDIPYEPDEYSLGEPMEVSIYIDDNERSISEPYETFTITEPMTKEVEFHIAPGSKAYYQVIINEKFVKTETIAYPE
ncbi:Stk1 family PASTA domain-containing Ser/Thr kinase [Metabacillus fastidiosus]|uniref:Stk1 family PASTA domain-containing Ser/Thr kinase n=1 Tax=Metabacillus fastidiosus TaxID=1458 RepID=UPI003D2792E6